MARPSRHLRQLPCDRTAPATARDFIDQTCDAMAEPEQAVVRLLTSELVANAIQHGVAPVLLIVVRDGKSVLVEVHDDGELLPMPGVGVEIALDGDLPLGRGLRVVAAMATSWGVLERGFGEPGKVVWFRLGGTSDRGLYLVRG